jgi:hypothetical protein
MGRDIRRLCVQKDSFGQKGLVGAESGQYSSRNLRGIIS